MKVIRALVGLQTLVSDHLGHLGPPTRASNLACDIGPRSYLRRRFAKNNTIPAQQQIV